MKLQVLVDIHFYKAMDDLESLKVYGGVIVRSVLYMKMNWCLMLDFFDF